MGLLIEVIEWRQDDATEIVHRFEPGGEIKWGAQLTVAESQWALFFRDGRALDAFEAGRHRLSTKNIPLLVAALRLPYAGESPFRADVYFVARKTFADLKWGTREPVVFRDPQFGMVRLRAHGRFAVAVREPRAFVNTLVGTLGRYRTADIEDYLREIIVARLNDALGERATPLLDLPRVYDEVAQDLAQRVTPDFARLGLALEGLYLGAIVPPEEVAASIDEGSSMAAVGMPANYAGFKAARALGDAARGAGNGEAGAAGQGMGLGVGAALGMAIPGMMRGALAPSPTMPAVTACSACGQSLPEAARFCPGCGTSLATAGCRSCRAALPAGARFCPACGSAQS